MPSDDHIVVAPDLNLLFVSVTKIDSDAIAVGQLFSLAPEVVIVVGALEESPVLVLSSFYVDLDRLPL